MKNNLIPSTQQEALRDLNEELEENHIQTEHDLREELEMNNNKLREVILFVRGQLSANKPQSSI